MQHHEITASCISLEHGHHCIPVLGTGIIDDPGLLLLRPKP